MRARWIRCPILVAIVCLATLPGSGPDVRAARPEGKTVQLICQPGWRASAVGTYGGVSFGVTCNSGRGTTRLSGTVGTAYQIRMGAESSSVALDCAFSGDSAQVNESCGPVVLTIH